MTECNIFSIAFPEEKRNVTAYMERIHDVFVYLSELFTASDPLNEKMSVLLGIATYSYKRLKEIYEHNMFNQTVDKVRGKGLGLCRQSDSFT